LSHYHLLQWHEEHPVQKLNPNIGRLITILSDAEIHSGADLAKKLKMTRAGVWKLIQRLEHYGIPVESFKARGYRLTSPISLYDEKQIRRLIKPADANKKIRFEIYETMPSSNQYLKTEISNQGLPQNEITICLTEQQTEGRGRLKRKWHSPFGSNIYCSCHYPFQLEMSELAGLSLVVSIAIMRALHSLGIREDVGIKWPNDIFWQGKKLGGSLIELIAEANHISHAVIGIGLNVNMVEAKKIDQPWVSLSQILGEHQDKNQILTTLLNNLLICLDEFNVSGFTEFAKEWKQYDLLKDRKLTLLNGSKKVQGQAAGIDREGCLLLKLSNNKIKSFSSGDVTIQKG